MLRRLVAIVGPTGTGKSAAAIDLAGRLGGEIVNADSRQVFRGMNIGTAKPPASGMAAVRHHLYDICEPTETYGLARYVADARAAFESTWARGSFPWLVGGTGQYTWALLEAWQVPEVPPDPGRRAELEAIAERAGSEALHARLEAVDPVAACRIDHRNVRRVIRALEVFEVTGRPITDWQAKGEPDFEFLVFGLEVGPSELDARIARRTDEMFTAGLVEETKALLAAGVPRSAPAMSAIGYAECGRLLDGELTLAAAKEEVARATRRFARRQRQWFRRDDPRIRWVRDAEAIDMEANIFTGACTNALRGASRW